VLTAQQGSTVGRYTEVKPGKTPIMKDNNFTERNRRLHLGPDKRTVFLEQIKKDSEVRPPRVAMRPARPDARAHTR